MSGREVNELIVALRPVGTDETQDALEETQDSFVETADTAEDASEDMEEFGQRFTGAMAVATTALGIAAAGILSKVPILQSAFAGVCRPAFFTAGGKASMMSARSSFHDSRCFS